MVWSRNECDFQNITAIPAGVYTGFYTAEKEKTFCVSIHHMN